MGSQKLKKSKSVMDRASDRFLLENHILEDLQSAIHEVENPVTYCNHRNCNGDDHRKGFFYRVEKLDYVEYMKIEPVHNGLDFAHDQLRSSIINPTRFFDEKTDLVENTRDNLPHRLEREVSWVSGEVGTQVGHYKPFLIVENIYKTEVIGKIERLAKKAIKANMSRVVKFDGSDYTITKVESQLVGTFNGDVHLVMWC